MRGERAETSDVSDVSVHFVTLHHDGAVAQRRGSVRRLALLGFSVKLPINDYIQIIVTFCLLEEKEILLRRFLTLRDILTDSDLNHHLQSDTLMLHSLR